MIEAEGLTRRYGEFTALRELSFSVPEGEILGLLGPNGAGKTTAIRMITGFLPPTSGRVTVAGHDLLTDSLRARRQLGYVPETVALYPEMRVREYLAYRSRLEGLSRADGRRAIATAIERCLLGGVEEQIIGTLSKGYRQRVGLATAILHDPQVLVLDEPTIGLDPKQIIAIRELIRELGRKRTLLLSTHILPEVEQLCHRVLILDRGRRVAEGTPQELREQSRGRARLRVVIKENPAEAEEALGRIAGATDVRAEAVDGHCRFLVECEQGTDLREAVFRTAVDRGWVLLELVEEKVSLEDVFVRLTADETEPEEAVEEAEAADEAAPESEEVRS